jgi:transcriptional regulator with XRE-family HTH domain
VCEVNERIKQLRRELGLSQVKFAEGISISNGYLAGLELGKRDVNERIAKLICAVYDVSEHWLKTGDGEMFLSAHSAKQVRAIDLFEELTPEFQDYALHQIGKLLELQNARCKR